MFWKKNQAQIISLGLRYSLTYLEETVLSLTLALTAVMTLSGRIIPWRGIFEVFTFCPSNLAAGGCK